MQNNELRGFTENQALQANLEAGFVGAIMRTPELSRQQLVRLTNQYAVDKNSNLTTYERRSEHQTLKALYNFLHNKLYSEKEQSPTPRSLSARERYLDAIEYIGERRNISGELAPWLREERAQVARLDHRNHTNNAMRSLDYFRETYTVARPSAPSAEDIETVPSAPLAEELEITAPSAPSAEEVYALAASPSQYLPPVVTGTRISDSSARALPTVEATAVVENATPVPKQRRR